jgi:hypothetical protein
MLLLLLLSTAAAALYTPPIPLLPFPSVLVQPISFVVIHKQSGQGKVTYSQITKQVDVLNRAFVDTRIRFALAGIRYVENDEYHDLCALPSEIVKYRPKYQMDPSRNLNVYVCWSKWAMGLSWLPYDEYFSRKIDESHYINAVIVHYDYVSGGPKSLWSIGKIAVHEVGHYYGLRHPYDGGCFGSEQDSSDGIADTPRMNQNPLLPCRKIKRRDSCPSLPGKDDLSNYMQATADSCRNHFTRGQVLFMQHTIQALKPTLVKQHPLSCRAAVDSEDSSPDWAPCVSLTKRARNGRLWCLTSPDDAKQWGWAVCGWANNTAIPSFEYQQHPLPQM